MHIRNEDKQACSGHNVTLRRCLLQDLVPHMLGAKQTDKSQVSTSGACVSWGQLPYSRTHPHTFEQDSKQRYKNQVSKWKWWCTPTVPDSGGLKQKDHKSMQSMQLSNLARPCVNQKRAGDMAQCEIPVYTDTLKEEFQLQSLRWGDCG